MTPRDAFLQAICENPDDEAPRLMYADWLTEHGDPRGEFIRVQCRLAGMSEDGQDRPDLERREKWLLGLHDRDWAAELPRLEGVAWGEDFRRGFVEAVRVDDVPTFVTTIS